MNLKNVFLSLISSLCSYIFIAFLLSFKLSYSQGYHVKNYNVTNGLPNNVIRSIYKDSKGLLWIGTDGGLLCHDGKDFFSYTIDNGLAGEKIWSIAEAPDGKLVFGCYGDGISIFNGHAFINYNKDDGLVNNSVRTVFSSSEGIIFAGTDHAFQ